MSSDLKLSPIRLELNKVLRVSDRFLFQDYLHSLGNNYPDITSSLPHISSNETNDSSYYCLIHSKSSSLELTCFYKDNKVHLQPRTTVPMAPVSGIEQVACNFTMCPVLSCEQAVVNKRCTNLIAEEPKESLIATSQMTQVLSKQDGGSSDQSITREASI